MVRVSNRNPVVLLAFQASSSCVALVFRDEALLLSLDGSLPLTVMLLRPRLRSASLSSPSFLPSVVSSLVRSSSLVAGFVAGGKVGIVGDSVAPVIPPPTLSMFRFRFTVRVARGEMLSWLINSARNHGLFPLNVNSVRC